MALGSSAPEILLSLVSDVFNLDAPTASEIGASTIVGSAAFNLLFISAVCIPSVDEPKKIEMVGVFLITSTISIFAYLWLVICLEVNSPNIVTSDEAVLTILYFFVLIILAFGADKYNQRKVDKNKTKEERARDKINEEKKIARTHLRNLA